MDASGSSRAGLIASSDQTMSQAFTHDAPFALVYAVEALRLAVLSTAADEATAETVEPGRWMHIELFGHQLTYGIVREVTRYGRRWIEVTWPEAQDFGDDPDPERTVPEHSKLYHPNAVYAMHEVSSEVGMARVRNQAGFFNPVDDIPY